MKKENITTLVKFEIDNKEYKPVKNAISEELQDVISKVYQLDPDTGGTLHFLTNIMMEHFHEDVTRVPHGDLTPIEHNLNVLSSRIEHARLALFKDGYEDEKTVGNPMWYLRMALQDIELINKIAKKAKGKA